MKKTGIAVPFCSHGHERDHMLLDPQSIAELFADIIPLQTGIRSATSTVFRSVLTRDGQILMFEPQTLFCYISRDRRN